MSEEEHIQNLATGLVNIASWISSLAVAALIFMIGLLMLISQGKEEFSQFGVKMKISYFWIVSVLFTFSHALFAYMLVKKVDEILVTGGTQAPSVWSKLTNSNNLLFNGMQARTELEKTSLLFSVDAKLSDTSILFSGGIMILILATSIFVFRTFRDENVSNPFSHGGIATSLLDGAAFGIGISLINWFIGSAWAGTVSQLAS